MANETVIHHTEAIETIKEGANMANEKVITKANETPEVTLPKFNDVMVPADEDRLMLYITATRNKNDAMFWNVVAVAAGENPKSALKTVNENKFVNLVDMRNVRAFVEAEAPLRGMASTIADFAARFAKTMGVEVTEKAVLVLREFTDILAKVEAGTFEGRWDNPEAIAKAEAKAKEEADKAAAKAAKEAEKAAKKAEQTAALAAEDEVEDPFEVEE